ncbi:MAG TPA: asparagine synthase (glutamine-hydrolyzing) [Bacteriovoracaceae bacterium]|nr:asparagine synthase (glutamine-hydrolyzing) [Bacteriovoracaceae bacterium]
MCGIWARVHFKNDIDPAELLAPVNLLSHRGPDGYGWMAEGRVALLHTRLSIIDVSGGAQPLKSSPGPARELVGIINGELYDYQQIRESLTAEGLRFSTKSDSEVLLNLFALKGSAGLSRISGEYAFIFLDRKNKKLHFGRDPHGVKPLFYKRDATALTLSSEMKAISCETPVIDEAYTKSFIGRMMIPPRTALKDVFHVLPGRVYTLDIDSGALHWENFQALPLFQERSLSREESLEKLESELLKSIRRRLVADVDVGCYLSGGVDSALVTAMAVELGAKPEAFTVGFSDRDLDESDRARAVARHLGVKHSVVTMTGKNFFPSLIKSIVAFENPVTNPHGAAKNLLSAHAAKSVKVVLSGEGADEWLGGYSYLRIQKLKNFIRRHPAFSKSVVERYFQKERQINMGHLDGKSSFNDQLIASYFNGKIPSVFARTMKHRMFRYLTGSELSKFVGDACQDLQRYLKEEYPQGVNDSHWDFNSWTSMRTDLLHYILVNVGDRQEMAHSLEGRTPFLDPALTQVVSQIPERYLIYGLTEKWALREVASKYLPMEIWNHRKHPFFAPMKYLYLKESREGMKHYMDVARVHCPWLDWKNIDRFLLNERLGSQSVFEGTVISMKLILFSLGVIVEELRQFPLSSPRGYALPRTVEDLLPYKRGML